MLLLPTYEKVLVKKQCLGKVVSLLLKSPSRVLGLDFEAYGLDFDSRMFSMIIACEGYCFYFNYNANPDHLGAITPSDLVLDLETLYDLKTLFQDPGLLWCIHNAKYDMQRLYLEGYELAGPVHCTYAAERVLCNNYMAYDLGSCAKRRGWEKDSSVEEYIKKHKLSTLVGIPGKKKRLSNKHYDQVPFEIMSTYGFMDGILHREIGLNQLRRLNVSH